MQINNTQVFGFGAALRSLRNPLDSWDRSDSKSYEGVCRYDTECLDLLQIGPNDLELACKLVKNGSEHRKFLRLIQVWATWTLPRYVWVEADTYKVGMTKMSCSTMHKLGHRDLTKNDFQDEYVDDAALAHLNCLGKEFRKTKNYDIVKQMKMILPEGFLQKADINFNYETALNMFRQRKNHRLDEWRFDLYTNNISICNWLYSLPYLKNFTKE